MPLVRASVGYPSAGSWSWYVSLTRIPAYSTRKWAGRWVEKGIGDVLGGKAVGTVGILMLRWCVHAHSYHKIELDATKHEGVLHSDLTWSMQVLGYPTLSWGNCGEHTPAFPLLDRYAGALLWLAKIATFFYIS